MHRVVLLWISFILAGCIVFTACSRDAEPVSSDISADESVVFFRTAGWLDEARQEWRLPIHGWIYEPQDSTARKALLSTILESEYDLVPDNETEANFTRRLNLLIADSERGKEIVVDVAGGRHVLPPSGENGHFETTLVVPAADVENASDGNVIRYSAVTRQSETRRFSGEVLLVRPAGVSIISDIDDTVKITNVTDRRSLLEHTFLLDFTTAPGMAQLYAGWSAPDVSLHFVSSSPWQLYTPLDEFLAANDFPRSTFSLKAVRFRDETLFELFKKGTETKPAAIEKLLQAYPRRKFVLVGDSGEQDPEVYAAILQKYPGLILGIYIRNVTQESAGNERFNAVFGNIERDRWRLFDSPSTLPTTLGATAPHE